MTVRQSFIFSKPSLDTKSFSLFNKLDYTYCNLNDLFLFNPRPKARNTFKYVKNVFISFILKTFFFSIILFLLSADSNQKCNWRLELERTKDGNWLMLSLSDLNTKKELVTQVLLTSIRKRPLEVFVIILDSLNVCLM